MASVVVATSVAAVIEAKPERRTIPVVGRTTIVAAGRVAIVAAVVVSGTAVVRLAIVRIAVIAVPAHIAITGTINAAAECDQRCQQNSRLDGKLHSAILLRIVTGENITPATINAC
jgi:hypothetical protein